MLSRKNDVIHYLVELKDLNGPLSEDAKAGKFMSTEDFARLVPSDSVHPKTKVSSVLICDEALRWADPSKPKTWKNVVVRVSVNRVTHLVHVEPCFSVMS